MQATARRLSVVSATSCARRRLIRDVHSIERDPDAGGRCGSRSVAGFPSGDFFRGVVQPEVVDRSRESPLFSIAQRQSYTPPNLAGFFIPSRPVHPILCHFFPALECLEILLPKRNEQGMRGNLYYVFWWILAHAFGASILALGHISIASTQTVAARIV